MKTYVKDIRKLKSLVKEDNPKKPLILSLLDKAEFMEETLVKLQEQVREEGCITDMPQGNYSIKRGNPALQQYVALQKNYNTTIKQLNDLLPKETDKKEVDVFEEF